MSVTDINAKKPPVIYAVRIAQHWDGKLEFFIEDVQPDERSLKSVAWALRKMADLLDADASLTSPPAVQTAVPSEREWGFPELCELLPEDSHWNIELTPDLLQRILSRAALASPSAAPENPHVGSSFDNFLNDEGIAGAVDRVASAAPLSEEKIREIAAPYHTIYGFDEVGFVRALSRTAPDKEKL